MPKKRKKKGSEGSLSEKRGQATSTRSPPEQPCIACGDWVSAPRLPMREQGSSNYSHRESTAMQPVVDGRACVIADL